MAFQQLEDLSERGLPSYFFFMSSTESILLETLKTADEKSCQLINSFTLSDPFDVSVSDLVEELKGSLFKDVVFLDMDSCLPAITNLLKATLDSSNQETTVARIQGTLQRINFATLIRYLERNEIERGAEFSLRHLVDHGRRQLPVLLPAILDLHTRQFLALTKNVFEGQRLNIMLDELLPLDGSRFGLDDPANDHIAPKLVGERRLQVVNFPHPSILHDHFSADDLMGTWKRILIGYHIRNNFATLPSTFLSAITTGASDSTLDGSIEAEEQQGHELENEKVDQVNDERQLITIPAAPTSSNKPIPMDYNLGGTFTLEERPTEGPIDPNIPFRIGSIYINGNEVIPRSPIISNNTPPQTASPSSLNTDPTVANALKSLNFSISFTSTLRPEINVSLSIPDELLPTNSNPDHQQHP